VRSLTVIEPPASAVARGVPSVDAYGADVRSLITATDLEPVTALRQFTKIVGAPVEITDSPPEPLLKGIRQLLGARPPDEAELPLRQLRDAPFRILAVSGGHAEPYEVICDTIARETGAERAVCPGQDHLVPDTGAPFNDLLERFFHG
jgi:hypothetical protein